MAAIYFACIWGWGALVCRRLLDAEESLPDFVAARLVTGCLLLYAAFILLASTGYLHPAPVIGVCAAGLLFTLTDIHAIRARARAAWHWIRLRPLNERALLAVVCCLAMLQLACALTPLTFYDSQVYQLAAPVQFLRAGYLIHIPWNVLTNSPQALQLTLGMSWAMDETGSTFKLLMAVLGSLSLLGAFRIGNEAGFQAGLMSALFVGAYPEFWIYQTFGVVDFAVASFLVFGVIWWMDSLRRNDWNRTFLASAAFGLALASRYQAAVLATWILIGVTASEWIRNRKIIGQSFRKGAVIAVAAMLMALPWLIRNYSAFGNPVFPFMQAMFGGSPEWSTEQAAHLQSEVMGASLTALPIPQMLMAPINALLIFPSNGLFGMVLLMMGLMAAYSTTVNGLRLYAVLGLGGLVIWGLIHPEARVEVIRFNSASLILLLTCAGAMLVRDRLRELSGMYVALTLALGSVIIAILTLNSVIPVFPALVSAERRTQLWQSNVPSWQAVDFANQKLDAARHKILLIGEARTLWLRIPSIAPSGFNGRQLDELFAPVAGSHVWMKRLHDLGITHILVCSSEWQRLADTAGFFRLPGDDLNVFLKWLHTLPVLFDDHRGNVVLGLVETAP